MFQYHVTSTSTLPQVETPQPVVPMDSNLLERVNHIQKLKHEMTLEEGDLLEKAMGSRDPDVILKAQAMWDDISQRQAGGTKATIFDPNEWSLGIGYKTKRYFLDDNLLRRMAATPIVSAVIGTRQTQISAFSSPQSSKYDTSFVIRKKKEYYTQEEPKLSKQDKEKIKYITDFLLNCGDQANSWQGDNFDTFLRKITEDSLTMDKAAFEIGRDRKGDPYTFKAVDGATIKLANSYDDDQFEQSSASGTKDKKFGYYPSYVQVIDGAIKAEFYPWELCFGTRNTSTDINKNGYGTSEIERLITIITGMLNADTYNNKFFSQGSNPKGILKVSPGVNRNRIAEFRQQWQAMVTGLNGAWRIPMIESDKMEFQDLQKNNTDMQFGAWQEYLIKVVCAVFKIAPEEIGFKLGNSSGSGEGMGSEGNDSKIKYSRDKGLKPLLKSIEFWINKWIVNAIDQDFEFKFSGIDIDSEKDELEMDVKRGQSYMGWKELRRKAGLKEDLEEGDAILNSVWAQMENAKMYQEQSMQSTDTVNQDSSQWDSIDQEQQPAESNVAKSLLQNIGLHQYADNPMMQEAMAMLM